MAMQTTNPVLAWSDDADIITVLRRPLPHRDATQDSHDVINTLLKDDEKVEQVPHEIDVEEFANLSLTTHEIGVRPIPGSTTSCTAEVPSGPKAQETHISVQVSQLDQKVVTKTEDDIEFRVYTDESLPHLAYSVKHKDERPESHGVR